MLLQKILYFLTLRQRLGNRNALETISSLSAKELWNASSEVVIGGCGLLSKRPTRYSSRTWPTYMLKNNGIYITSWEKLQYRDFTEFSIGCALLGYKPKSHALIKDQLSVQSPLSSLLSSLPPPPRSSSSSSLMS